MKRFIALLAAALLLFGAATAEEEGDLLIEEIVEDVMLDDEGEELPPDFECPLCHHGPEDFERIEPEQEKPKKQWVCSVCGYVHEGDEPPRECPICHVGPENFEEK